MLSFFIAMNATVKWKWVKMLKHNGHHKSGGYQNTYSTRVVSKHIQLMMTDSWFDLKHIHAWNMINGHEMKCK